MRISDWSSDVCSSDLHACMLVYAAPALAVNAHRMSFVDEQISAVPTLHLGELRQRSDVAEHRVQALDDDQLVGAGTEPLEPLVEVRRRVVTEADDRRPAQPAAVIDAGVAIRSEENTSELQSIMRNS